MPGTLSLLTELLPVETKIRDEFPGHISRGEFGKGITVLYLRCTYCTLVTETSMILSLPDLKELSVEDCGDIAEEPLPTYSVILQRGPLNSLELLRYVGERFRCLLPPHAPRPSRFLELECDLQDISANFLDAWNMLFTRDGFILLLGNRSRIWAGRTNDSRQNFLY
jgi:hypothetical protein